MPLLPQVSSMGMHINLYIVADRESKDPWRYSFRWKRTVVFIFLLYFSNQIPYQELQLGSYVRLSWSLTLRLVLFSIKFTRNTYISPRAPGSNLDCINALPTSCKRAQLSAYIPSHICKARIIQ